MAVNQELLDQWSWAHLGVGVVIGALGVRYPTFAAAHVVYDLGEQAMERTPLGQRIFNTRGPENLLNAAGDLAVASMGWWVGRWLRQREVA